MAGWRPALRIARRSARRSIGRTVLIAALIGLPVAVAVGIDAVARTVNPTGEQLAGELLGDDADALVSVTPYKSVTLTDQLGGWRIATQPVGREDPARTAKNVRVADLLPPGSRIARAPMDARPLPLDVDGRKVNASIATVDAGNELTEGRYDLVGGRMPAGPDEAALSPSMAEKAGLLSGGDLRPGAQITTGQGERLSVVGLATMLTDVSRRLIWLDPDTALAANPAGSGSGIGYLAEYLVDLPDGADPLALQQALAKHGVELAPRSWIVDPPDVSSPVGSSDDLAAWAAVALVIGFGLLEVVLLAGTAFAVGIRRQTRELGLVQATGGTARQIRRIVLAQGLFLGLVGAAGGVLVAILVLSAGRPVWERITDRVITGWDLRPLELLLISMIGLLSGLAAALVPARMSSKMTPLAALAGRFKVVTSAGRIHPLSIALVVAGVAAVVAGSGWLGNLFEAEKARTTAQPDAYVTGVTPTAPIAVVVLGITAVVAGLVWMTPRLVGLVARLGGRLPLSPRLALRDAGRHRHRTGPATAAIMITVAGCVAASFALSNGAAKDRANYQPETRYGDVVVRPEWYDESTMVKVPVDAVAAALPTTERLSRYWLTLTPKPGQDPRTTSPIDVKEPPCTGQTCYGYGTTVIDPDLVRRLAGNAGADEAEALEQGRVVAISETSVRNGRVQLIEVGEIVSDGTARPTERRIAEVPAVVARDLPDVSPLRGGHLMSPPTARKYGQLNLAETHLAMSRTPTDDELAAARKAAGAEEAVYLEQGFQNYEDMIRWLVLGAATLVTLFGVGISVALSAAEGRSDLATLAAVGAPPRRRRTLAAAQAWLLGQLGCLLGIGVGALYGYTGHVAVGSPYFAVPWASLAAVAIGVPGLAAAVAWGLSRSKLPMVRRIE